MPEPTHNVDSDRRDLAAPVDPRWRQRRALSWLATGGYAAVVADPLVLSRFAAGDEDAVRTIYRAYGRLAAGAAAWSLVHGLATLWLNGNLPEQLGDDPEEITRLVAPYLSIPEQDHPPLTPVKAPGQAGGPPTAGTAARRDQGRKRPGCC